MKWAISAQLFTALTHLRNVLLKSGFVLSYLVYGYP